MPTTAAIKELFRLSWRLAVIDFKLRNEGSYLGILWYILNPVLLFLILFFIFFDRLGYAIESYPAYLIIGMLLFSFFQKTTSDATRIIVGNGLIKSIAFRHEALVLSVVLKNVLVHSIEAAIFFFALLWLGVPYYGIFAYFVVLGVFALFVYGVSLILAGSAVYIVDIGHVWQFFTTLLWFATPIFYAIEGQSRLFALNQLNPPFYFITAARDLVVYHTVPAVWTMVGIGLFVCIAVGAGSVIFARLKVSFAEMV